MKKLKTMFLCLACVFAVLAVGTSARAADNVDILSEILTADVQESSEAGETVILEDMIEFTLPADWTVSDAYEDDEIIKFQYESPSEEGVTLLFSGCVADFSKYVEQPLSYHELMKKFADNGVTHLAANINGIDMLLCSEAEVICGIILDHESNLYLFGFELDETAYMSKIKDLPELKADMVAIFHSIKAIHPEKLCTFDKSAPEFEPVSFRDTEFERMVRACIGKTANAPIYPTELSANRELFIRTGKVDFFKKPPHTKEYEQPGALNLADLSLFPNLERLYICDTSCTGLDVLTELKELRNLVMIRAGVTDCGFLTDMTLRNLNLSGNMIGDFTPISTVKELRSLNLDETGLASLEILRGLDLNVLVVSFNPVEDLSPLSEMEHLSNLSIQHTKVKSLEPLRNLKELKKLNIMGLEVEISLEPLSGNKGIEEIESSGTTIVE